jgi:hypothetical protein
MMIRDAENAVGSADLYPLVVADRVRPGTGPTDDAVGNDGDCETDAELHPAPNRARAASAGTSLAPIVISNVPLLSAKWTCGHLLDGHRLVSVT